MAIWHIVNEVFKVFSYDYINVDIFYSQIIYHSHLKYITSPIFGSKVWWKNKIRWILKYGDQLSNSQNGENKGIKFAIKPKTNMSFII
jgi:hypothetical protein